MPTIKIDKGNFKSPRFCEPDKPNIIYGVVRHDIKGFYPQWQVVKYDRGAKEFTPNYLPGKFNSLLECLSLLYSIAKYRRMVKYPISTKALEEHEEEKELLRRLDEIYAERAKRIAT